MYILVNPKLLKLVCFKFFIVLIILEEPKMTYKKILVFVMSFKEI